MLAALNDVSDAVEASLDAAIDLAAVATRHGTTEYHLRRMFSSLAGMPVSEYVRRRRMTHAAADVTGSSDGLLTIAVRFGYGSAEAFSRAFRAVHGITPGDARRSGGPLLSQQQLRFRLSVEGSSPMQYRLVDHGPERFAGHAVRVPLIHRGENARIREHIESLPPSEHARLKSLSAASPGGILQVSDDVDPDGREGTELTYLHGVAVSPESPVPEDLDVIVVAPGPWAVFTTDGPHPDALQSAWAATATEWFPSQPWRLRPGPSVVSILDHSADFTSARCELWMPVERDG
ncbi:AraC family transcriptional regulator [Microbacterium karelineae]|uniref:AraC family transcriptional regulator n=1 Tax=Microbacterium karelineae TaxID=2654283 RepID=UPI0012E9BB6F|nr:AraC family transcriptional regulator [Microbacterium karelineae]